MLCFKTCKDFLEGDKAEKLLNKGEEISRSEKKARELLKELQTKKKEVLNKVSADATKNNQKAESLISFMASFPHEKYSEAPVELSNAPGTIQFNSGKSPSFGMLDGNPNEGGLKNGSIINSVDGVLQSFGRNEEVKCSHSQISNHPIDNKPSIMDIQHQNIQEQKKTSPTPKTDKGIVRRSFESRSITFQNKSSLILKSGIVINPVQRLTSEEMRRQSREHSSHEDQNSFGFLPSNSNFGDGSIVASSKPISGKEPKGNKQDDESPSFRKKPITKNYMTEINKMKKFKGTIEASNDPSVKSFARNSTASVFNRERGQTQEMKRQSQRQLMNETPPMMGSEAHKIKN